MNGSISQDLHELQSNWGWSLVMLGLAAKKLPDAVIDVEGEPDDGP